MILLCLLYCLPLCFVHVLKIYICPKKPPPPCKQYKIVLSQELRLLPAQSNLAQQRPLVASSDQGRPSNPCEHGNC